jgi:hypothetical protein
MNVPRRPAPHATAPENALGDAAGLLGDRLDNFLGRLGRIPGWAWGIAAIVVLVWTYPRRLREQVIAGVVLDDRLTVWMLSVVVVGLMVVAIALSFFVLRAVLHYMEQGRWPRRAVGVEMDELAHAESQLDRNAQRLSDAADETRKLRRTLSESRDTIIFLRGELARVRGVDQGGMDESQQRVERE